MSDDRASQQTSRFHQVLNQRSPRALEYLKRVAAQAEAYRAALDADPEANPETVSEAARQIRFAAEALPRDREHLATQLLFEAIRAAAFSGPRWMTVRSRLRSHPHFGTLAQIVKESPADFGLPVPGDPASTWYSLVAAALDAEAVRLEAAARDAAPANAEETVLTPTEFAEIAKVSVSAASRLAKDERLTLGLARRKRPDGRRANGTGDDSESSIEARIAEAQAQKRRARPLQ